MLCINGDYFALEIVGVVVRNTIVFRNKDYGIFCEFLGLVFEKGNAQIREEIGKVLCKLSKQKLSDLDEAVKDVYHGDRTALRHWDEIKDVAESTSPILNNLSNLFKRKKD